MTQYKFSIFVPKVHSVALTVAEDVALGTDARTHPLAVAIDLVTILPYLPEIILVDVALMIVGTDAGTGSYRAVNEYRAHRDARLTTEEKVADVALVVTHKALAAVVYPDAFVLLAVTFDKLHQLTMLLT